MNNNFFLLSVLIQFVIIYNLNYNLVFYGVGQVMIKKNNFKNVCTSVSSTVKYKIKVKERRCSIEQRFFCIDQTNESYLVNFNIMNCIIIYYK